MEKEKKALLWTELLGPIFEGVWPLDTDLQTSKANFSLIKLLIASGEAFGPAADVLLPFIQPEKSQDSTSVFLLAEAPSDLFALHPRILLNLISALLGDPPRSDAYHLRVALSRIEKADPDIAQTKQFQKLSAVARS